MGERRRFLGNTTLAFAANVVVKAGSSLLFLFIGRALGPSEAGIYNLAVTFLTITLALSAWGLDELLVREVAPRREASGQFLVNYLLLRLLLAVVAYILLLFALATLLPYSARTDAVIRIIALALFPEALFTLCHALFVAHERLGPPTAAAVVNSTLKFGSGLWLIAAGAPLTTIAWVLPVAATLSLLVYFPFLIPLLRGLGGQILARPSLHFAREQFRQTPGFILIGLFSTIDFQLDTFLISLFLGAAELGWYGAAQMIMLGLRMMPVAVRTTIYPLLARARQEQPERLPYLYRRINRYLLILGLPIAAGITLIAEPLITLLFTDTFAPTAPALRVMIWTLVFSFLTVPNARLMLVHGRQRALGWLTGLAMLANVLFNLLLIPRFGITGAAAARTLATVTIFLAVYTYARRHNLAPPIHDLAPKPLLATALMTAAVYPLRHLFLPVPVLAGAATYLAALLLLRAIPPADRHLLLSRRPW